MFNSIEELIIHIGIPIKDAKGESEIHQVIAEAKKESVQYNLDLYKTF